MAFVEKARQILRWRGTIGRTGFLLSGILLAILKSNVSRYMAMYLIPRFPDVEYFAVPWISFFVLDGSVWEHRLYFIWMLLLSIPFLYIGLGITLARLRSIRANPLLAAFFVIPIVNLLFFATLCVIPEGRKKQNLPDEDQVPEPPAWKRYIPRGKVSSALFAGVGTSLVGILLTMLSSFTLGSYGLLLFVGVPFVMGLIAVLIFSVHQECTLKMAMSIATLSVLFACLAMLILALEGIACVIMALPLAIPLALIGGLLGYCIQRKQYGWVFPLFFLGMPIMMGAEYKLAGRPPLWQVDTSVEVDAPPEVVWKHVISFTELPPMTNPIFAHGIAYPIRAEMHGEGVGAVRHCVFSTGPFVEPIEVWDAPHRLEFSVTEHPPAFQEWTAFHGVVPPYIDNYFRSERGRFLLEPLDDGKRTKLTGTTWYRHEISPALYWRFWSSTIVHYIHTRVLDHVKALSEEEG